MKSFILNKKAKNIFWRTSVIFVWSLIPLFWTSEDVCPGFQSQGWSLGSHASSPTYNGFLRFISGVTPADRLSVSIAAESFTYYKSILETRTRRRRTDDFWWRLPRVSKPRLIPGLHASSPTYNGFLRFISSVTPADRLSVSIAAESFTYYKSILETRTRRRRTRTRRRKNIRCIWNLWASCTEDNNLLNKNKPVQQLAAKITHVAPN